jgi:hypothetical protein
LDLITYKLYKHNKNNRFNKLIHLLDKIKFRHIKHNDKIIEDNEKVTSQALTNLDTRVGYPKDGDSAASGLYKYIDDKVSGEHGDLTALEERVTTAEGKLDVIQGNESTPGSINKALADAKSYAELLLEWEEVTE